MLGLLIAGPLAAAGCGSGTPDKPDPAPEGRPPRPPVAAGPPRLAVASTTVDLGEVPQTEKSTGTLEFTNEGTGLLTIEKIDTTCGCTAVTLDRTTYGPGESGSLLVEFDPTAPGEQKKQVTIISNDPAGPVTVKVLADVRPFIAVEPTMLQVSAAFGHPHQAEVTVRSPVPGFRIDGMTTTNPHVTTELQPRDPEAGPDVPWRVTVHVSERAPWGGLFSWLHVTGTGTPAGGTTPITHTTRIRIQGQVYGRIRADRDTFRFGVEPAETFTRDITLTRTDGAALRILEATVACDCLGDVFVRAQPVSPTASTLTLTATGLRSGRCDGEVIVTTDAPGEERLRLPIVGVVR